MRPALLSGGDTGSLVALGLVELEARLFDAIPDEETDPLLEATTEDLVDVENVTIDETIAVTLPDADDSFALLGAEADTEGIACEGRHALVDSGQSQFDCVGVASTSVVCGGAVGHAVSGPNSTIR